MTHVADHQEHCPRRETAVPATQESRPGGYEDPSKHVETADQPRASQGPFDLCKGMGVEHRLSPENIDCHLQEVGMGSLVCRAARRTSRGEGTNEVTPETCVDCEVGKIFREVGCDAVTAKILFLPYSGGVPQNVESIFCSRRKSKTSIEYCRSCDLVVAQTTRQIVSDARGLFSEGEFYSAYKEIERARTALRNGELDDAITASIACLESVMLICHQRLGKPIPAKKQVTDLWKSTRDLLRLDELQPSGAVIGLANTLSGVVSHLGSVRNELGDAHGKVIIPPIVTEAIAELALNVAATLSTFIVRCFRRLAMGGQ